MTIMQKDSKILSEVIEIEHHIHNKEHWFGKSADQSGTDWALENGLTPFRCISGDSDFGSDTNDEAKLFGTSDTPVTTGYTKFDVHRLLVNAISSTTVYVVRFVWSDTSLAAGISAGNFSTFYFETGESAASKAGGMPINILMPRLDSGIMVWVQCKNATNNATLDFFIGIHEYQI